MACKTGRIAGGITVDVIMFVVHRSNRVAGTCTGILQIAGRIGMTFAATVPFPIVFS